MTRKATAHSGAIPSVGSTAQPLVVPEVHIQATFRFVTKVYDLVLPIQADRVIVRNGVTDTNQGKIPYGSSRAGAKVWYQTKVMAFQDDACCMGQDHR
jgi:hypothetical protein